MKSEETLSLTKAENDWKSRYFELLGQGALFQPEIAKSADELKLQHVPQSLFKYRSFDRNGYSIRALQEDTIWLSSADSLNDPYDCFYFVNYDFLFDLVPLSDAVRGRFLAFYQNGSEEMRRSLGSFDSFLADGVPGIMSKMEKYCVARGMTQDQAAGMIRNLRANTIGDISKTHDSGVQQIRRATKICAFSAADIRTAFLMWSHYADQHRGFCIEYDGLGLNKLSLYPIVYSKDVFDVTRFYKDALSGKLNPLLGILMAMVKYKDWKYENEWRIIVRVAEIDHGIPTKVTTPKAVYLGTSIRSEDRDRIGAILKERNIPSYKMRLSDSKFSLIYDRIA